MIRWLFRDPVGHLYLAAVFAVWCAVWFLWANGVTA